MSQDQYRFRRSESEPYTPLLRHSQAYIRSRLGVAAILLVVFPLIVYGFAQIVLMLNLLGIEHIEQVRNAGLFGESWMTGRSVSDLIFMRLSLTLTLMLVGLIFSLAVSIPLGILGARDPGDGFAKFAATLYSATPGFWLALLAVLAAARSGLFPIGGFEGSQYFILPGFVLGMLLAGYMTKVIRSAIIEAQDGGSVLRGILISAPALLGAFLSAAVVIELVFVLPGIGHLFIQSMFQGDLPVTMTVFLIAGIAVLLVTVFAMAVALGIGENTRENVFEDAVQPEAVMTESAVPVGGFGTGTVIAVVGIAIIIFVAFFAPIIAPHDPFQISLAQRNASLSAEHPLGTDSIGRDVLSRLLYGVRTSAMVAFWTLIPVGIVGGAIGVASAQAGVKADAIITAIMDSVIALPTLIFAIYFIFLFGAGFMSLMIVVTLVALPRFARAVRDELTDPSGGGPGNALISAVTMHIGFAMLLEATLSFLGSGLAPQVPSLGSMASLSRAYLVQQALPAIAPGLALMLMAAVMMVFPLRWSKITSMN